MPFPGHAGGVASLLQGLGDGHLIIGQSGPSPGQEHAGLSVRTDADWKTTWGEGEEQQGDENIRTTDTL